jgi:hypothetical protein
MPDKICPRCGSWNVSLYTQGYYICRSDVCRNGLLEEDELTVVEVAQGARERDEMSGQIKGLLSLS